MCSIIDQILDPDRRRILLTAAYSEVLLLESLHQEYHRVKALPESPEQKSMLELVERDLTVLLALWQISRTSLNASSEAKGD